MSDIRADESVRPDTLGQAGQAGVEPTLLFLIARGEPGWAPDADGGDIERDVVSCTFHAESCASWIAKSVVHRFECSTGLAYVHGHIQDCMRSLGSVGVEELATFDAHSSSILGQAGEVGPDLRRPTAGLEVPDPPHRTGIVRRESRGCVDRSRPGSEAVGRHSARPPWRAGGDSRLLTVAPRAWDGEPTAAGSPTSFPAGSMSRSSAPREPAVGIELRPSYR
jgi:hypothetical protein